jgi:hypothetical protein
MRFLKLASNRFDPHPPPGPYGNGFIVPFTVDVSTAGRMVAFSEGVAHGYMGGAFSLAEALTPGWASQFPAAQGEWLLPYLQRLADGESVTDDELIARFVAIHGREPESYEWDIAPR